jgi:uncharacterized protein YyaL (SSP411 family)
MGALHRLGEQGGWPLTMFLDSDAKPFWGGTYFPREARYGRPAFVTVLLRIAEAYQNQPDNVRKNAEALVAALKESPNETSANASRPMTKDIVAAIARAVDREHGGLSGAPKFPQWSIFWRGHPLRGCKCARSCRHHTAPYLPGRHLRSSGRRLRTLFGR